MSESGDTSEVVGVRMIRKGDCMAKAMVVIRTWTEPGCVTPPLLPCFLPQRKIIDFQFITRTCVAKTPDRILEEV